MFAFLNRLIYSFSNKIFKGKKGSSEESRLIIDFSKSKSKVQHPFNIKPETSYNAYLTQAPLRNNSAAGALALGIKKTNCIAYVDIPNADYQDNVIDAKISLDPTGRTGGQLINSTKGKHEVLDSMGGYASAGIIFRILNQDSYYMALVSSKGYFRFDVIKDGAPRSLIAWTEVSNFNGKSFTIKIISYGSYLIFVVNDVWVAEISDDSIDYGAVGFAAASYDSDTSSKITSEKSGEKEYTCIAYLEYFSIDTRVRTIEDQFKFWTDDKNINADTRLKLAETFAVMDKPAKAMDQINRAWQKRDDVIRGIATTYTEARTKRELLLAARMSFRLGQFDEALKFIDSIIEQWPDSKECKLAYTEKIKILNELDKFEDLYEFLKNNSNHMEKDVSYYTMLARCCFELKDYKNSAKAWKEAFKLNANQGFGENGVYAANAANALDNAGKRAEAVAMFLAAGKIFLRQDNNAELEAIIPRMLIIGTDNWEVCALAGKWYFSIENYERAEKQFTRAEKLRLSLKPKPNADPALYYLLGLVYLIKGKKKEAVKLLEKAVKLAPDYELFRVKLEEVKR